MQETLEAIKAEFEQFLADAEKRLAGNKAAGTRSRKSSTQLGNLLKTWRKVSIDG